MKYLTSEAVSSLSNIIIKVEETVFANHLWKEASGQNGHCTLSKSTCAARHLQSRRSAYSKHILQLCLVLPLSLSSLCSFATPCDEYPKPSLRYIGLSNGPVRYSVPYPISSLFKMDPAPVPEMKYFGLGVRTTTNEKRYRIDGVSWTPQASNPSILFTGLDISGTLIPSNYGVNWANATITFLPTLGDASPIVKSAAISDWTLVYQLVKQGLSTSPPSNDWGCQWGVNGTSNVASRFVVGTDSVTVSPATSESLGMLVSGTFGNVIHEFDSRGPGPGPTFYLVPDMSNTAGITHPNQVIVYSESHPPALQAANWDLSSTMPGPVEISVPLRAAPRINISVVKLSKNPAATSRLIAGLSYLSRTIHREHLGFDVLIDPINDLSQQAGSTQLAKLQSDNCSADLAKLSQVRAPKSGAITVYVVDSIVEKNKSSTIGFACSSLHYIVLTVNTQDPSVLTHELGHMLSLDHAASPLTNTNIMWPSSVSNSFSFTDGQVFRMHFSSTSFLAGTGGQPPLVCGADPRCPPIDADVWIDSP